MAPKEKNKKEKSLPSNATRTSVPQHPDVTIFDILLVLVRNGTLVGITIVLFTALGAVYGVITPDRYTSSAQVVREVTGEESSIGRIGGISALRGLGINLGGASNGLTPDAFPRVLNSREVRLAVVRDTFVFSSEKPPITFVEHVRQTSSPGTLGQLIEAATSLFSDGADAQSQKKNASKGLVLTKDELQSIRTIEQMVSANIDDETGLMTISVTASTARLATDLTDSFVRHLQARIRSLRTQKVRERLNFVEERFQEAEEKLNTAEENLARFLERNQNPTTATLQFQEDRLRRQVSFKEQLFSELQSQLTQTRLDLQRRQPVVTIVEQPMAPLNPSGPQRLVIVLLGFVVGGVLGAGIAFARTYVSVAFVEDDNGEQEKIVELKQFLRSLMWWK